MTFTPIPTGTPQPTSTYFPTWTPVPVPTLGGEYNLTVPSFIGSLILPSTLVGHFGIVSPPQFRQNLQLHPAHMLYSFQTGLMNTVDSLLYPIFFSIHIYC